MGPIVIALTAAFGANLLPALDASAYTASITGNMFDPLLTVDKQGRLIGDIVNKWWFSADKKTIYFHIDPKARWSNGRPVTAKDVELGVDWLASKSYNVADNGEYGYEVNGIVGAAHPLPDGTTPVGFKIINAHEFSISCAQVDATNLAANLQFIQPLPAFILGKLPMSKWKDAAFNKLPTVGDGPYIIKSIVPGQSVTLAANPFYLHGKPLIPTTVYKVMFPDVAMGALISGQVNMATIHARDVAKLKRFPTVSVNISPESGYSFLGWRLNNAVYGKEFSNVYFRQAVEYAINREALVKAIDKGYGKPEDGPLPPVTEWYNPALAGTYAYNPQKADQLLDKAGFTLKNGWRMTPDGRPFTPTLAIPAGDQNVQVEANFIQQFLQAVHINVKVLPALNFNTLLNELNHDLDGRQPVQGFFMGWQLGPGPQDPRPMWLSGAALNTAVQAWREPADVLAQSDKLLVEQAGFKAFDSAYRKKVLDRWQVLVNQQLPANFLTTDDIITAYSSNLHGVVFSPYGALDSWAWHFGK